MSVTADEYCDSVPSVEKELITNSLLTLTVPVILRPPKLFIHAMVSSNVLRIPGASYYIHLGKFRECPVIFCCVLLSCKNVYPSKGFEAGFIGLSGFINHSSYNFVSEPVPFFLGEEL